MRRRLFGFAAFFGLLLANGAQAACWAPNHLEPIGSEDLAIGDARLAPLNRQLDVIEAALRANAPALESAPDLRWRVNRQVNAGLTPAHPRSALVIANGYGPQAWRGDCDLIPQADRLGARLSLAVFVNHPLTTMNRYVDDGTLTAYLAKDREPQDVHGWPVFGSCALMSRPRRLPWMPVSTAEWLDAEHRRLQRELAQFDAEQARRPPPPDARKLAEIEAALKQLDARQAEKIGAALRQQQAAAPAWAAQLARVRQQRLDEIATLQRTRAQMPAAALEAPMRIGSGAFRLPGPNDRPHTTTALVRLDPAFGWDAVERNRIQLLQVCAHRREHPVYGVAARRALAEFDFARIEGLLR